jgi:hypothetical protein
MPSTGGNAGNVGYGRRGVSCGWTIRPAPGHSAVALQLGVIAMRRTGTIVARGALLNMFRGAGTASPALAAGRGWSRRISRFRRLLAAIVVPGMVMGVVAGGALSAPALADTSARALHLADVGGDFTSFTCLNDSCSLAHSTFDGDATSNLSTGRGSFHADLIVDFLGQPAPGGNCNIVDESDVFTFTNGTIFVHSRHEDCATHGLRIDTTFQVTRGTGAFTGASGSGREFSAAASPTIIYNGTISF